jgi:hypothetical protein
MTPRRYRKKPVVVEAVKVTRVSAFAAEKWCNGRVIYTPTGKVTGIDIATLEGVMTANLGDYVIKGVKGEFYPCKPDIFDATYEAIEEEPV